MIRRFFCATMFAVLCASVAFGSGKKDITEKQAETLDSWQETFDITEKKAGKYNIVVTAEDQGGNIGVAGPYNVMVDPDSDLPVVGVTNPVLDMRIPGNLNIVGTCVDDDAVGYVELVLDGDEANPVRANGAEFWSHYLDTTQLSEGRHTIKAYGVDINGVKGHPVEVAWHLDRRQPVTTVENYGIGTLVSGDIELSGTVMDGNGIESLSYSVDGGGTFEKVRFSLDKESGFGTFSVPVDTTAMADGAAVCWFKAVDKQGSTGLSSFLFFVDNTGPTVRILSPAQGEAVNGVFSIVGSAVDSVEMASLEWTFGEQSGTFELVPGNPYWVKEFDVRGYDKKSVAFSITATDTAGNRRTERISIPVDAAADKAVLDVQYPVAGSVVAGTAGELFVRGVATDDDGVAEIHYAVDGGAESVVECDGVFCIDLTEAFSGRMSPADSSVLSAGGHSVSLYAVDIHGVRGVPASVAFTAQGELPVFESPAIVYGGSSEEYTLGMEVHPEAGGRFVTTVRAASGIARAEWFVNGVSAGTYVPDKPETSSTISIPLDSAMPWGVVTLDVRAQDVFGRESRQESLLYFTNLTRIASKETVVFQDSSVAEDGTIDFSRHEVVTGFFAGGNAASAELRPATEFASVSLSGNTITLSASGARGKSEPVRVVVTSDRGLEYESRPLQFVNPTEPPVVVLDTAGVADGTGSVRLGGRVVSGSGATVEYRILPVAVQMSPDGLVATAQAGTAGEVQTLAIDSSGTFEEEIPSSVFGNGIYILEVTARNSDGSEGHAAQFVRKIPPLPSPPPEGKKTVKAAKPIVVWAEGHDVYYAVVYQGDISDMSCAVNGSAVPGCYNEAGVVSRSSLRQGENVLSLSGMAGGNAVASRHTVSVAPQPRIEFASVAGTQYASGCVVSLPQTATNGGAPVLTVRIKSGEPLKGVGYTVEPLSQVEGQCSIHGGSASQSGRAVVRKMPATDEYEADIPLQNLPVQWLSISVTAEGAIGTAKESAVIGVVREKDAASINDAETLYWLPVREGKARGFFNIKAPLSVSFATGTSSVEKLTLETDGRAVFVSANECGVYPDVSLVAEDSDGVKYSAPPLAIEANYYAPELSIDSPDMCQWVQNTLAIRGTASDLNGVAKAEFSLDGGVSWSPLALKAADFAPDGSSSAMFTMDIPLDLYGDGFIPFDVRVTDALGAVSTFSSAVFKDTMPPEVQVVAPAAEDVVNGETTIVFKVRDNGRLASAEYNAGSFSSELPAGGLDGEHSGDAGASVAFEITSLPALNIGTDAAPMHDGMRFRFADVTGNVQTIDEWDFVIDNHSDLPRPEIHLPEDNQIVTTDFIISGVVFDDDGESKISYRIDDGEYIHLDEYGSAYSIEIPLSSMTDNEHTVYVYAEDVNGVRGEEVSRTFRVSLEEPKGAVVSPDIEATVKESIVMSGWASDKNGISLVQVSLDNGNTYNDAVGTEEWSYAFDTRMIQDGTHVVFLRIYDGYGIEALYSSLITIDNTVPDITLELPLDDSATSGMVFFSGQTIDNVELVELYITIRALDPDAPPLPPHLERIDLVPDQIITQAVDLSTLPDGFYNVELTGSDAGENTRRVSRNIRLDKSVAATKVNLMYPMNGEHIQGVFNVYGTVSSETPIERMLLYVDGAFCAETQLSATNAYKFELTPELVTSGKHQISVRALTTNQSFVESNSHYVFYEPTGPWISIDNFTMMDFAVRRPYLEGRAGYVFSQDDLAAMSSKETSKEEKKLLAKKKVASVELSFDNGKTFTRVSKNGTWRYRIENDYLSEGYHFIVARATMANGETAVTRTIIQIDKTLPYIKLISPGEGGHFNERIEFSGLASDDVGLSNVTFALRSGDKSSYEVPAFIQGLYFDWHFWGATLYDIGVGLTFFDDNVKLQLQFGQFSQAQRNLFDDSGLKMRYGGNVFGLKMLANIAYVPFQYFFGPDLQWLSAGFAIGANFSLFTETQSGKPQMLSAILAQIEFPRVTLPDQKLFRTFSLYTEGQLWFLPTDVQAGDTNINSLVPQISAGIRVNVF